LFISKQEGNSFAFAAAKNYRRKMLIKIMSLELWVMNMAWWR